MLLEHFLDNSRHFHNLTLLIRNQKKQTWLFSFRKFNMLTIAGKTNVFSV